MQINRNDTLTFHSSLVKWGAVAPLVASAALFLWGTGNFRHNQASDVWEGGLLLAAAVAVALWRDGVKVAPGLGLVTSYKGWGPFVRATHYPIKSIIKVVLDAEVRTTSKGGQYTVPTLDLEADDRSRIRLCSGFKWSIQHKGELVSAALGVEIVRTSLFLGFIGGINPWD